MMWPAVVLAIALIVIAGVLVAIDAAISAFSKARAEELIEEGLAGAQRLVRILEDPAPYLNSMLLLRVLTETTGIVIVAALVADEVAGFWTNVLIAGAAMAVVSFVVVGVGPRTLGRQQAERIAVLTAGPVVVLTTLLGPIPKVLIALGNALTPGKGFKEGPFASEVEVRELVDLAAASSVIESDESKMIQSVFELDDTIAREVMVPRTDLVFIESTKTLRQAMSLALRSGYSRIPVVGENLDEIVGMAYLKDITKRVFDNRAAETQEKVDSICRPCLFVPDTKHADELLREMQADRTHVAIVIDEYGGTAGMVTIEDILEEIVGEITDEYDAEPDESEELADGSWRVSARFSVDDIEDLVGVSIEDEDVDSVGGLMAKCLGYVPIPGSVVEFEGLRFEAQAPSGRRNKVGRVLISSLDATADAAVR
ncbi:MAG: HlyC/CorC family transporter [Actinomycetales bacterium]|nr:HlyC/CorC family transporter [Actinomycetales bacterium]